MSEENFESKLNEAAETLGLTPEQMDFMRVYQMERAESARNLLDSAVGDGVHFAERTSNGVFVNIEWLKMVLVTAASGALTGQEPSVTGLLEVISDTVEASNMFVELDSAK